MWPVLVQLLKLAPHVTRLAPVADRYLQSKADNGKSQRRALDEMGERLRGELALTGERMHGDVTRLTETQAGILQQLTEQSEALERIAAESHSARLASEALDERIRGMEARMARLWMIFIAGIIVLAILAAVMIALLLHIRQSLHGS